MFRALVLSILICSAYAFHSPLRSYHRNVNLQKINAGPFKNFDDMLEKLDVPVLVDFYAQWWYEIFQIKHIILYSIRFILLVDLV